MHASLDIKGHGFDILSRERAIRYRRLNRRIDAKISTLESKETEFTAALKKIEKDLLDMQYRINSNSKRLE